MKRSRVFLGVTTALLAIAGVAAARTHRLVKVKLWYYTGTQPVVHRCLQATIFATRCGIVPNGTLKCYYVTHPSGPLSDYLTLYTQKVNAITCGTIARYRFD